MSAQSRGWGPPPTARSKIDKARAPESGAEFPGGIHQDLIALFLTLVEITERRGYKCVVGWCWGYAARKIRGSDAWSNHAWGLAGDINAPKNPMTSRLVTDMPSWMPNLWERYGFRWGGRYKTRPDAMHYEFMGRPEDVPRLLAAARAELAALGGSVPPPTQEDDDIMKFNEKSEQVKELQNAINLFLRLSGGLYDGGGLAYPAEPEHGIQAGKYIKADGHLHDGTVAALWHCMRRLEMRLERQSFAVDIKNPSSVLVGYLTSENVHMQREYARREAAKSF